MRKSLKIMIAKAEEIIKIWDDGLTPVVRDHSLDKAIEELKEAIKKVKGEA